MKLSRKEREKLRKTREIIEASIKVFSEKGFYKATMQDIAKVVEMGVGTIYQYFRNKDDLYYNAILYKFNEFHQFFTERLKGEHGFVEGINIIIQAWIEYFGNNQDFFSIVFSEWANIKGTVAYKLKKRLMTEFRDKRGEIVKLVEKAKRTGEIKDDVSTEILSSMIFGSIQFIIHRGTIEKDIMESGIAAENIIKIISLGIFNAKGEHV